MFEGKDYDTSFLANPLNTQAAALDEMSERLGGELYVASADSPFCYLLEFGGTLMKVMNDSLENSLSYTYESRAQTMDQLYRHTTDYDYVNMFSTPATTTLRLTLNRAYLYNQALSYNDNYKKVIIPRQTVFKIGRYTFGIHYPIEIRISKLAQTFLVTWDTDISNPLYSLSENLLTTTLSDVNTALPLLHIDIPVQQFACSYINETMTASTGFIKKYKYNYKFWAIRVFNIQDDGSYVELNQTLTKDVYDPKVATARITVDTDAQTLTVDIPQIYFTNGLVTKRLFMEVYTTFGALDVDLANVTKDAIDITYHLDLSTTSDYSKILYSMPTQDITLLDTKLLGGSDGYEFAEWRERVINNNFYETVPITPSDILKYFSDEGFGVVKYLDNITSRIYYTHRMLTDDTGQPLPATSAGLAISASNVAGVSSIKTNPDGSYTLLPTTLYSYDASSMLAKPLTDSEVNYLSQLSIEDRVDKFNTYQYNYTPFHLHLQVDDRYPLATSYNLVNCSTKSLSFIENNDNVASQILVLGASISHLDSGVGGYQVELIVTKSDDLVVIDEAFTYILVDTINSEGHHCSVRAIFNRMEDKYYIYRFMLDTDYWFNSSGQLHITNLAIDSTVQATMLDLESTFYITCMVNQDFYGTTVSNSSFQHLEGVSDALLSDYIVLLKQSIVLHLGHSLSDVISNVVEPNWSEKVYARYEVDVPAVYTEDIYARDDTGKLIYAIVDGQLQLTILHAAGDPMLDGDGNTLYQHRAGAIIYDDYGQPTMIEDRETIYNVTVMQFDARLQLSNNPDHITFRNGLASTLESYFDTIRNIQPHLLERTYIYFQPTRTMGTAIFSLGDGITQYRDLALAFKATCYVPKFVYNSSTLKQTIQDTTADYISDQIASGHISMLASFKELKDKLSDYIVDIDILGIDGNTSLQTLVTLDEDVQPILAQQLTISRTGYVSLVPSIDIMFVVSDTTD